MDTNNTLASQAPAATAKTPFRFEPERFRHSTIYKEDLPVAAIDYLLGYGYSKSMQDKIAGQVKLRKSIDSDKALTERAVKYIKDNMQKGMTKAQIDAVRAKAAGLYGFEYATEYEIDKGTGKPNMAKPTRFDEARITAECNDMLDSRHADILAGTVNTRAAAAAPKVDPITKHMMESALATVTAAITAKGMTLPAEDLEGYAQVYFESHYAQLRAAAELALTPAKVESRKVFSLADIGLEEEEDAA